MASVITHWLRSQLRAAIILIGPALCESTYGRVATAVSVVGIERE